jgi:hypothetical protein
LSAGVIMSLDEFRECSKSSLTSMLHSGRRELRT